MTKYMQKYDKQSSHGGRKLELTGLVVHWHPPAMFPTLQGTQIEALSCEFEM